MQVHHDIENLPAFRNAVVTIGTFDGVHQGHRQIIDHMKQEAVAVNGETIIITFHPHPRKVVSSVYTGIRLINTLQERIELLRTLGIDHLVVVPFTDAFANQPAEDYVKNFLAEKFHPRKVVSSVYTGIRLINTLQERIELLRTLGIDHLVVVPFTDAFANQPAEDYVKNFLAEKFHPRIVIIGYDHRFGRERQGDYLLLEKLATVYNFKLKEIPKHILEEISISSTNIREALLHHNIEMANKLLGYEFFFEGEVIHGDKLGRELGYPTANLKINDSEKIIPGDGIYAVYARVNVQSSIVNKGMMSIGFRPTVDGKKRVVEVNIFDFDKEIYGQTIRVFVKKYLRPEVKFNSLPELIAQIDNDKVESLKAL